MNDLRQLAGTTFHGRRGAVANAFTYRVDYVLLDMERPLSTPWPFRRNRPGLLSLWDRDHGGPPGRGRGAAWVRAALRAHGLDLDAAPIRLLTQPRVLGHVFNPVSFWLVGGDDDLRAVIAEVSNTYGDRHAYLCRRDDGGPIGAQDVLTAAKLLHVSPFQDVAGGYRFRFDIRPDRIAIRIEFRAGPEALIATLAGPVARATTGSLMRAMVVRPLGARRVLTLIHWQAAKLWWKGAPFRPRPAPPATDLSG